MFFLKAPLTIDDSFPQGPECPSENWKMGISSYNIDRDQDGFLKQTDCAARSVHWWDQSVYTGRGKIAC